MRKNSKKTVGLVIACLMLCMSVADIFAASSYDVASIDGELLLPGDSLVNINEALPVIVNGKETALETPGTWTNDTQGKAYSVKMAEDGSTLLNVAGYRLVVENGTSNAEGGDGNSRHHTSGESDNQDVAFYPAGQTIHISAASPAEGKRFAGWIISEDAGAVQDPSNPETSYVMREKKVKITANYEDIPPEPVSEELPQEPAATEEIPQEPAIAEEILQEQAVPDEMSQEPAIAEEIPQEQVVPDELSQEPAIAEEIPQEQVVPDELPQLPAIAEEIPQEQVVPDELSQEPAIAEEIQQEQVVPDELSQEPAIAEEIPQEQVVPDELSQLPAIAEEIQQEQAVSDELPQEPQLAEINPSEENPQQQNQGILPGEGDGLSLDALAQSISLPEGTQLSDVTIDFSQNDFVETPAEVQGDVSSESAGENPAEMQDAAMIDVPIEIPTDGEAAPDLMNEPAEQISYLLSVADGFVSTAVISEENRYTEGTEITITANDRSGEALTFAGWTVTPEGIPVDLSLQQLVFTMPAADVAFTANYQSETPQSYQATVNGGVDGNNLSEATYTPGEIVTIKATPDGDQQFTGWSGMETSTSEALLFNDAGQMETTFVMPEGDVLVVANYQAPPNYQLSITGGIDGNNVPVSTYTAGSVVTLTATPALNQQFTGWTGLEINTSVPIVFADASQITTTFTMPNDDVAITANYTIIPSKYNVTVSNGTITGGTQISGGIWEVPDNTTITVTANPNPAGQAFSGWNITDSAGNPVDPASLGLDPYSSVIYPTITKPLNFAAQYQGVSYSVIVKNGAADYSTAVSGTAVTISAAQPPSGTKFDCWNVISGNVALADTHASTTTFVMPASDVAVEASYKTATYTLKVKRGYSDKDTYKEGAKATIRADYPDTGKEFDCWELIIGDTDFHNAERWKTTLIMPAENVKVKALYKNGPSTDDNCIADIVIGGEYYTGDVIKFTAVGADMDKSGKNPGDYRYIPDGYQIGSVTGNWTEAPYTTSMTIKTAGEYTLKVTFKKQIYDGKQWVDDGTTDIKSITFKVIQNLAVNTGDETPIQLVVGIAAGSAALFLILLFIMIQRRKRK